MRVVSVHYGIIKIKKDLYLKETTVTLPLKYCYQTHQALLGWDT